MITPVINSKPVQKIDFRDQLATLDEQGKRKWIFATKPSGKLYRLRSWLSLVYFSLFFGLPFLYVNDRPLFLFNILEAKFILFGKVFWPQDFFILGLGMIAFILFIILFTAAFGRLFCGWACPQTNFMEMMFRKIEYFIEGDALNQKLLNRQQWYGKKIFKKLTKHVLFFSLSVVIANCFLAYIIGIEALGKIILEPVDQHLSGFVSLLVFSGIFYGVYAHFREQVCTVVCPYGRLQGVLLDKNSMAVAYDYKRGEPRGITKKLETIIKGDCIDCYACVKVCPTGIDIRNGLQMECIGCTACIDACNHIMEKIGKPTGLIRYASEDSIATGKPLRFTRRMKMYTALCAVVVMLLSFILITRKDVDATIMRTPGILFQTRGTDSISNLYNIKVANKTNRKIPLSLKLYGSAGSIQIIGKPAITVASEGQGSGSFFVVLPVNTLHLRKTSLTIAVYEGTKQVGLVKTNFLGPVN